MTTNGGSTLVATPSPFAVFRRRNFSLMWTGQLVDTIGSSLTSLAASILIFRETGSAASVGLMLIATAAPSVLLGLFAGVIVDRYDRKRIMISANIIRAVLVFLIPILVPIHIAWLYVLVALASTVGQFFDPAHESLLPEVAPDEELAAANSMMAISSFGSTAIGFAASGFFASFGQIQWAFYLDALTFLASAVFIALIAVKPLPRSDKTNASVVMRNLRTGLRFLYDTPILRSLFLLFAPFIVASSLTNTILLPFADRALGMTDFQFGIQEGVTSIGFVIGSLAMAAIAGRLFEGQWMTIGFMGIGLMGMLYSQSTSIPVAITLLFFSGMMNAPAIIARRLVIQRNSPREMRGRVSSAFFVSRDILFLLGMALAALADVIDVRIMYFLASLTVLLTGLLAQLLPGLRHGAAEWRQALSLLRAAPSVPGLGMGRAANPADLDLLVGLMPELSSLSKVEREGLLAGARVLEAPADTAIVRYDDDDDNAYFILSGRVIVGHNTESGNFHSLNVLEAGDFFGEIAALTGSHRTADVVTREPASLMQVASQALRGLMGNPVVSQLVLSKMTERLSAAKITDLPRFAGYDQKELRELRRVEE